MAIHPNHHLPSPTEPRQGLRSYREAASHLAEAERLRVRGASSPAPCPTEPRDPTDKAADQPPCPCASPRTSSDPKPSPTAKPIPKAEASPIAKPIIPKAAAPTTARCRRSRTPSPPHPAPPSRTEPTKAPRSISPGGTPASSAPKALRKGGCGATRSVTPERERLRVSWAEALVASVITRPRTLRKDVAGLYYSRADEKRFRREAAAEDDELCEVPEASMEPTPSDHQPAAKPEEPFSFKDQPALVPDDDATSFGLWSPAKEKRDYAISRAVVVFGDATLTYGSAAPGTVPAVVSPREAARVEEEEPFSFDDDAFWNGRLTWS